MAYQKQTWVNGETVATAEKFKHIEDGVYQNSTDIASINSSFNNIVPAGMITMYGGSTAPDGWLICNGSAVSRTTYSRLFSAIGTTYGSGNGSTTFNLPNIKGRVPVGLDTSQTEFNSLGKTGGEKKHTLTINEMPSHNHDLPGRLIYCTAGGEIYRENAGQNTASNNSTSFNTGGGQSHNNLQPYITVNYIIKAN